MTREATGPGEPIVDNAFPDVVFDDFAIDFAGNAWIVSSVGEVTVSRDVTAGAQVSTIDIVAGSTTDTKITGHTAAKFRTSSADLKHGSLHATTSGGALGYMFSNWTTGGMLRRYDVGTLYSA